MHEKKGKIDAAIVFAIIFFSLLTGFIYTYDTPARLQAGVFLLLMLSVCVGAWIGRCIKPEWGILFTVCMAAFIIRADYIIYTPTWIRQHDVIGFGTGKGQAGYIEYFLENHHMPDFDPREKWGFFQPPLHHVLAAIWLDIQYAAGRLLGWSLDRCRENVQILTLIYGCLCTWIGSKCLKFFDLTLRAYLCAVSLLACAPCFIFLSGSINNDLLCILLQIAGMYFFFVWMKKRNMKTIIPAAIFMGLSMMAKLSGIMLAAPMGCMMMYYLFIAIKGKDKKEILGVIEQYLVFALISIPLGVFFPVRNLVIFGIPLTFTPKVGEPIEGVTFFERIFSPGSERTPFVCMQATGHPYDEFNVPLAIIKTALFGEAVFSDVSPFAALTGWVLLISAAILAVLTFWALLHALKKRDPYGIFMVIYILFSFAFLVNLCFKTPNFSSQDFRYIAHVIIPAAGLYAVLMKDGGKILKTVMGLATFVYCASSLFMYMQVGLVIWN